MSVKVKVYNKSGKNTGTQELPEEIFGLPENYDLVYQVYRVKRSNTRKPYAHAKTRAEVRGGGRKPWPQKGLGRARHGSIRSPIWKGGGITFGPHKNNQVKKAVNKKMNRKALFTVLSSKAKTGNILVMESFDYREPKTKEAVKFLENSGIITDSNVVYGTDAEKNFIKTFRNLNRTTPAKVNNINILDLLSAKNCIFSKSALEEFISTYVIRTADSDSSKTSKNNSQNK